MPRPFRHFVLFLALLWTAAAAVAQSPTVIRIGIATGGVGNLPRTGNSTIGIVDSDGLLEKEFARDGIKVDRLFFKNAGPAVNEALVNRRLDFAWQGDLPSIVHRADGVKTRIVVAGGVRRATKADETPRLSDSIEVSA